MSRVGRIIVSFAIVLGTYWLYRLTAVPFIEPEAVARSVDPGAAPVSDGKESVRRHEALLAQLYADGAWQRDDPIVMEGDHVMFVMKEWQNLDNGQVRLNPCTMIFFPSGDPNSDPTAISRAIVLEAPQGALLQFDEAFDIRRAKIGKLVGGHMPGTITVRGNTNGPHGQDEIFAQTHDVQLSEDRIWTPHPVEFRIGPSYGSGREMQIHLLPGAAGGATRGPNIGGIESFELLYEVTMHLQPQGGALFPGDRPSTAAQPDAEPAAPQPPIDIACQGPFRFELTTSVASFRDQVNVVRPSRGPQNDQLTCEKLSIFFQPRTDAAHAGATARARGPERGMSNLEPRRLEADGLPVVVTSPSTGTYARGQHLEYDIALGRLKLAAEDEALLHQEANEVRGRKISYEPLKPSGRAVAAAADDPATQNPPQISIAGAAQLRSAEYGQLTAEEIHIWLMEQSGPQTIDRRPGSGQQSRLQPDRLLASGNVDIRTTAVSSPPDKPIDTLEVWFKRPAPGQEFPAPSTMAASLGPQSGQSPVDGARAGQPGGASNAGASPRPQQHFEVSGQQLQMQVMMQGRQTVVDRVTILGDVFFSETVPQAGERPLVVTGSQLQVEDATSPDTMVTVIGTPAHVEARGLTLTGAKINMSRRQNRLWIDGPGQMTVPVDRDLQGRALSAARPMNVVWRERMDFDGLTAQFVGEIEARSEGQVMRTETMDVSLAKRIDFNQPPRGERPQVALLLCRGAVFVEGQSVEPEPPAVQRMQMADLSINQMTGDVHANGPGHMTVVQLGRPPALDADPMRGAAGGLPLAAPRAPTAPAAGAAEPRPPQLMYLNVTFRKEITGNLYERQLTFHGQVDTLYGPVKTWDERLNADRIEGLGPQGVHLQSDDLKVIDMTAAAGRSNREIEAMGNVRAEGATFTARGGSLRYAEAKDLITLAGDGRSPATLYRQQVVGGQKDQFSAREIYYWRSTQVVKVDGAQMLDLGQLQAMPTAPSSTHHTPTKKPAK